MRFKVLFLVPVFFLLGLMVGFCQYQINRPVITSGSGTHLVNGIYVSATIGSEYANLVFASSTATTAIQAAPKLNTPKIALYPDPAFDNLTVNITNLQPGSLDISLYDISGNLVSTYKYSAIPSGDFTTEIDVKAMATGLYFLEVSSGNNNIYNCKFIKQ